MEKAQLYTLVTLQVSMATVHEVSSEMMKNKPAQAPPSTASRKDKNTEKDIGKGKKAKEAQPVRPAAHFHLVVNNRYCHVVWP